MVAKELDRKLIDTADFNSAVGMGSIIDRTYRSNIETVTRYDMPDADKQVATDTLYGLSTQELRLYSDLYPSISAVGPARYNTRKGLKSLDAKTAAAQETRDFMAKLAREQAAKAHKSAEQRLISAFMAAVQGKQKEFSCDGRDYIVKGRTRFVEKKYA